VTSREFAYWLQGYLEIENARGGNPSLTSEQVECIQKHLSLVFVHEIDPSYPEKAKLDAVHGSKQHGGLVMRC
jgi:hypothetical protein